MVYSGGFNADGSQNTCLNPAPTGSTVTVSLQGLGVTGSAAGVASIVSAAALVAPFEGVWQAGVQISPTNTRAARFSLAVEIAGQPVGGRVQDVTVWIK